MASRAPDGGRSAGWWDARLFWSWVALNAAAYLIIVLGGAALLVVTADLTPDLVSNSRRLAVVALAVVASALYGLVLGRLQWQVLKQRLPALPVRQWLVATFVPALIAFTLVIGPDALNDVVAGSDPFGVFKDAFVQAFVLGPLIGVAQATAMRGHTRRWRWWFVGNATSWLFGAATIEAATRLLGRVATYPGDSASVTVSPAFPLLAVAFHALWMLWVSAPAATADLAAPSTKPAPRRPPESSQG